MEVSNAFKKLLENLAISNVEEISGRYKRITKTLNKSYWSSDSSELHSLQVGSYGRNTAINGVSDLDMVFELPADVYHRFNNYKGNGQSALLQEVKNVIKKTYVNTSIKGDGQVVVIGFGNYVVEVLPAFLCTDNSYTYADSKGDGRWRNTKPRQEILEINATNKKFYGHLKKSCKILRSWKNNVGAPIGGLLIDTLCYNYLVQVVKDRRLNLNEYDVHARDLFAYLGGLNKDQQFWYAPGSNQKVYKKGNFVSKAKKAHGKCLAAIEKESNKNAYNLWREIFGFSFPSSDLEHGSKSSTTEEFIESSYNVDIQYSLVIDCEVRQSGFRMEMLSSLLEKRFPLKIGKKLRFYVTRIDVPEPYMVKWKTKNVGDAAERRNQVRGQIIVDGGQKSRDESSNFHGPHFVECYVIKDGVCVARDRIDVPISGQFNNA